MATNGDKVVMVNNTGSQQGIPTGYALLPDGSYAQKIYVAGTVLQAGNTVTVADGADVTQGAKTDDPAADDTGAASIVAILKRGLQRFTSLLAVLPASLGQKLAAASFPVVLASDTAINAVLNATAAAGGQSTWRTASQTKTGVVIKASAGRLYSWSNFNNSILGARYVKFYDLARVPTQADTPLRTIQVVNGTPAEKEFAQGLQFVNGLAVRATTGLADSDAGDPGAGDVIVQVSFS